jgi:hypothetical protein
VAADANTLAAIRDHVGHEEPPTDVELSQAWDRLATVEAVALSVVRQRLAALRARPARLSVDGDYTEDFADTIRALERQEAALVAAVAAGGRTGVVTVSRLTRAGRSR